MYIYVYMYICICVYMYICIYVYMYIYVYMCIYAVGGVGSPIGRQSGSLNLRKNNVLL